MSAPNFKRTKLACYVSYFTMSSVFCVPPLLFMTFRELYGISYTLLGTLVLVNFITQLGIDLIFTAFSKYFNTKLVIRIMPLLTAGGMFLYALIPTFFPGIAYIGLLLGTVVFSVAAGLSEVLMSPTIAAIPSDNPQRDMSTLHSLYAFGTFAMILVSALYLKLFGTENWVYLFLFLGCLPIIAAVLFMTSPIPEMHSEETTEKVSGSPKRRTAGLIICLVCIFFGSCAENTMSNWISTYVENALGISKLVGDILGTAMFAVFLGLARIGYAKFGKNICRTLLVSMIAAAACYLVVGLSTNATVSFIACSLTGFCSSMLWPGTLIMMEEKIPNAGVAAYALMAAGGDLGASVSPQLLGIIVDNVSTTDFAARLGMTLNITPEQVGLKIGMLVSALFPIIGIAVILTAMGFFKKKPITSKST
ncbi:MAG: MFS transporter [Oscillospiraceae bacterium]|nr:MFS transporter [Oscillospiraceae bacterium]